MNIKNILSNRVTPTCKNQHSSTDLANPLFSGFLAARPNSDTKLV